MNRIFTAFDQSFTLAVWRTALVRNIDDNIGRAAAQPYSATNSAFAVGSRKTTEIP
jgi:hypothetical protein